jgi:hypothetical protein
LAAALLITLGCDRGPKLYRVHGAATANGQPIPAGMIYFDPEAGRKEPGVQGFAYIKDGKYDTADEGRGVSGGKYLARIQGHDGQARGELPLGEALFPEQEVAVDFPAAETKQDFHLQPQN